MNTCTKSKLLRAALRLRGISGRRYSATWASVYANCGVVMVDCDSEDTNHAAMKVARGIGMIPVPEFYGKSFCVYEMESGGQ